MENGELLLGTESERDSGEGEMMYFFQADGYIFPIMS